MVVIKKIGEESIEMEEINTTRTETVMFSFSLIGLYIAAIFCIVGILTYGNIIEKIWGLVLVLLVTIACFIWMVASDFCEKRIREYRIFIRNRNIVITILKTNNEEADQAAICKAAKELEKKAWEFDSHRQKLERIARRCQ